MIMDSIQELSLVIYSIENPQLKTTNIQVWNVNRIHRPTEKKGDLLSVTVIVSGNGINNLNQNLGESSLHFASSHFFEKGIYLSVLLTHYE